MGTSRANLSLLTLLAGFSWLLSLIPSKEFKMFPHFTDQKLKYIDIGKATILFFARKFGGVGGGNSSITVLERF